MITFEINGCRYTCRPENAPKVLELSAKCHRKPRPKATPRAFPRFVPGMSVADYAARYFALNALVFKPCGPLSDAPQWEAEP